MTEQQEHLTNLLQTPPKKLSSVKAKAAEMLDSEEEMRDNFFALRKYLAEHGSSTAVQVLRQDLSPSLQAFLALCHGVQAQNNFFCTATT